MRITGFNSMLVMLYDFIGRIPPEETEDTDEREPKGRA
jgi:hypothetical protein